MLYVQYTRSYGINPNAGRERIVLARHAMSLLMPVCRTMTFSSNNIIILIFGLREICFDADILNIHQEIFK